MAKGPDTTCTQSIADEVLSGISKGDSLSQVCKDLNLVYITVYNWMKVHSETFFKDSPRAYDAGCDALADECLDIADDWYKDVDVDDKGKETVDHEVIQRSRLRIDTRLRLLGKWRPKKYGDRIQQDVKLSGNVTVDNLEKGRERAAKREKPEE